MNNFKLSGILILYICSSPFLECSSPSEQINSSTIFEDNYVEPGFEFWKLDSSDHKIKNSRIVNKINPTVIYDHYNVHWGEHGIEWDLGTEENSYFLISTIGNNPILKKTEINSSNQYTEFYGSIQRSGYASGIQYIEHFEPRDEGISLTWVVKERPAVFGKIVFGLRAGSLTDDWGVTPEGEAILARQASGYALRIGEATAVDFSGKRIQVYPEVIEDSISWTIPKGFLENAVFPICLDPVIGPERSVPQVAINNNENPQFTPEIVAVGDIFIAIWTDQKVDGNHRIWGTRIDGIGNILDPGGFLISDNEGDDVNPSIAVGGDNALVVWEDKERTNNTKVQGMFISKETGKRQFSDPIEIIDQPSNQQFPKVAALGNEFLIVCQTRVIKNGKTEFDIIGQKIDSSGSFLEQNPFEISDASQNQMRPKVAVANGRFHILWEDLRSGQLSEIYGASLPIGPLPDDIENKLLSSPGFSVVNPQFIYTGDNFVSAFQMRGEKSSYGIFLQELDFSEGSPNSVPVEIIHHDDDDSTNPSLELWKDQIIVVWEEKSTSSGFLRKNIFSKTATIDLMPLEDSLVNITDHEKPQSRPTIASGNILSIIMWEDFRNADNNDIYYIAGYIPREDNRFTFLSNYKIASNAPSDQSDPYIAMSEDYSFISWSEVDPDSDFDLHLVRVENESQSAIESSILNISSQPGDQIGSHLILHEEKIYIFWESKANGSNSVIKATILDKEFTPEDTFTVKELVKNSGDNMAVQATIINNTIFLIYESRVSGATETEINALYLDLDLNRISPGPITLSESGNEVRNPQTVATDQLFIFSYEQKRSNGNWGMLTGWLPWSYSEEQDPVFIDEQLPENNQRNSSLAIGTESIFLSWAEMKEDENGGELLKTKSFLIDDNTKFNEGESIELDSTQLLDQMIHSLNGINDNGVLFWKNKNTEEKFDLYVTRLNHDGRNTMEAGRFLVTEDVDVQVLVSQAFNNKSLITYKDVAPPETGNIKFRFVEVENSPRIKISGEVVGTRGESVRLPLANSIQITDSDSEDFSAGQIEITLDNASPNDQLEVFSTSENIEINRNQILYQNSIVGLFSGGKLGQSNLDIILAGSATDEILSEVLKSVHINFENLDLSDAITAKTGTIVLTDGDGAVSSPENFVIKIESEAGPPVLKSISPSKTVNPGEPITITGQAVGGQPLNYQWYLDGEKIVGANSESYKINNFTVEDSGDYTLEIWNSEGKVTSESISLNLITVDLCVRWRSDIGKIYHVVGKVSQSDAKWSSVSPAIEATQETSEFCLPLSSPFRLFEVRDGPPSTFTIQDPTEPVEVEIFVEDETICFSWPAIAGAPYVIETKRFSDNTWTKLGENRVFSSVAGKECIEPTLDARLYRVLGPPVASSTPIALDIKNFSLETGIMRFEWEGISSRFYQVQYKFDLQDGWENYIATVEETDFDFAFEAPINEFDGNAVFFRVLQLP